MRRATPVLQYALVGAVIASALSCSEDRWRASVYPTGNHLDGVRDLGEYSSLDECRDAARGLLARLGTAGVGTYECGKNCEVSSYIGGMPLYICEETLE